MNKQEIWDSLKEDEKHHIVCLFKESLKDGDEGIRFQAYQTLDFAKEALKDEEVTIRKKAYKVLGLNAKAFNDVDWEVRLLAYEHVADKTEDCEFIKNLARITGYRALGLIDRSLEEEEKNLKPHIKEISA